MNSRAHYANCCDKATRGGTGKTRQKCKHHVATTKCNANFASQRNRSRAARAHRHCEKPLELSGSVTVEKKEDEHGNEMIYTYDIVLCNCTEYPIELVTVDADFFIAECGINRPLIGQGACSGCFDAEDIDVFIDTPSKCCDCRCFCDCAGADRDCVDFDGEGVRIKMFDVAPGQSSIKIVVPLVDEECETPFPCTMLPSLITASLEQLSCKRSIVLYQTSVLVGDSPKSIACSTDCDSACDDSSGSCSSK